MNKKLILGMLTVFTMLFATSCTKEEPVNNVSSTAFRVAMKAPSANTVGEGNAVDKLIIEVYDAAGVTMLKRMDLANPFNEQGEAYVKIDLVKGQTYTIAFWAQHGACTAYDTESGLHAVSVSYGAAANDDNRDAFCAVVKDYKFTGVEESVTLKRPFAQLNFGVTEESWESAVALMQVDPASVTSLVTVSDVATGLNILTGETLGAADVAFTAASLPADVLKVDVDADGVKEAYKWLSMNYILVNGGKNNSDVSFTLKGFANDIVIASANTPLQENFRTNVIGSLTETNEFKVVIDAAFDGDINPDVLGEDADEDDIIARIKQGGAVILEKEMAALNLAELTIEKDLHLILAAKVGELTIGNTTGSANPAITVEVAKDVEYPVIKKAGTLSDYTIKGDAETSKPLHYLLSLNTATNLTLDGIKGTGDNYLVVDNATNVTFQNCVGTDMTSTFINVRTSKNVSILNNTSAFAANATPHSHAEYNSGINGLKLDGDIVIEGNTVKNAQKHAIYLTSTSDKNPTLIAKNNIIEGAVEDGIKSDYINNATITNNAVSVSQYGVRVDRLNDGAATLTIANNTISAASENDDKGQATYGICVNYRNAGAVTVNLTAKDNIIGASGIPAGRYVKASATGMTLTGDYYSVFVIGDGLAIAADGGYSFFNAQGLVYANANLFATNGNVYRLTDDIDMSGINWASTMNTVNFTFDGMGKTISNWTTTSRALLLPHSTYDFTIKNLTLKNCSVNNPNGYTDGNNAAGLLAGWTSNNKVVIENVHAIGGSVVSKNYAAALVGYVCDATITNCSVENMTITGGGSTGAFAGQIGYGTTTATVTNAVVTGCTITGEKAEKSGIVFGSVNDMDATITTSDITGNTVFGVANSGKVVGRFINNSGTNTLFINGAQYLVDGVTVENNVYSISTAQGFAYASANLFAKGGTFEITTDLDMSGVAYTTLDNKNATNRKAMTINGNNHTISNLKVEGGQYGALIGYASTTININDLTIANSTFAADNNKDGEYASGAFCGWITEGAKVNLNNCKSINNIIGSAKYVGGLCGFVAGYNPKTITNCQVIGGTITSEYTEDGGAKYKGHCGGLIGGSYGGTLANCLIQNTTITVKGDRGGAVVGSIMGGSSLLGAGNVVDNVTFNGAKATSANICGSVNNTSTPTDVVTVK